MDFGQESPKVVDLFKSDYGHEPEIWEDLDKSLTSRIAQVQGTPTPPSQHPVQGVNDAAPRPSALMNRIKLGPPPIEQSHPHPMVQAAIRRVNKQGIRVEDKMPPEYTPEMKSQAIHNVANGVEFLHGQFPGMQGLARKHNLKYTLQGPQQLGGGQLMGEYHTPNSHENPESTPKIELNGTAEQTLWHEHLHFLDHAAAGLQPRQRGTLNTNHPLYHFSKELQNHPIWQEASNREMQDAVQRGKSAIAIAERSGNPDAIAKARKYSQDSIDHVMYRNEPDEVMARWFNSHVNHLHREQHGRGKTAEPFDTTENEGWTKEHHDYFGPKFRDILRQQQMIKSMLYVLAKAAEPSGSWDSGSFNMTSPTKASTAVVSHKAELEGKGYSVESKMPLQTSPQEKNEAMGKTSRALDHVNSVLPGFHSLANKHSMKIVFKGKHHSLLGSYHGADTPHAQITLHDDSKHTLWHEVGHFIDHALKDRAPKSYASEDPSEENAHPLALLTDGLMNTPEHKDFISNTPRVWQGPQPFPGSSVKTMHNPKEHMYLRRPSEVFARFFNAYMNHMHEKLGTNTENQEPLEDEENWSPDTLEDFGHEMRMILRQNKLTRSFGEYLDKLEKALEETHQGRPLPGTHRAVRTPSAYKIPRKITRPGVRGSTLWWIDEKGTVRYGPKPVQKGPPKDDPQHVKNYLESEQPWSFMSAYSDSRDPSTNDQLHAQLGKQLQQGGYTVYPSKGYYSDPQGQLREEPSYLVFGLDTKKAIPIGKQFGQQTVLTSHGMFDLNTGTLAPLRFKRIEMRDMPKDVPQTVVLTQPNHVTVIVDTGQPVPMNSQG